MAGKTIHTVGGIVVRGGARPRVAVVQRSKDDLWVLPRGKLKRNERAVTGARRGAVEETGHRVRVREFLGAITYRVHGRQKVVQFWRMQAAAKPSHEVMKGIAAVEWLPLAAAIRRLSYPLEKLFLLNVGRHAMLRSKRRLRRRARAHAGMAKPGRRRSIAKARADKAKIAASRTAARTRPTMLQRVLGRLAR